MLTPRDYLASLEFHGIKLGLDNIRHLLERVGNPQTAYPAIHVAGSNGKGSVVAYLDAMFRAAGYKTGRFTSPHLRDLRERFTIGGEMIADGALDEAIETFREIGEGMSSPPTYFEVNTAIAFHHFAEQCVDIALVEVGMGGRFDSTNVIDPLVSVITTIALEHQRYLGDTLEKIAFEKAGIIKPQRPVVVGDMSRGAREVIHDIARELGCAVHQLGDSFTVKSGDDGESVTWKSGGAEIAHAPIALSGSYQATNAAIALMTAHLVRETFPRLTPDAMRTGLRTAKWPGRVDQVLDNPRVILDVSHNAAGMTELAKTIAEPCTIILAIANDKDARAIIQALQPIRAELILTQFDDHRAMNLDALCAAASGPYTRADKIGEAIETAFAMNASTLITGSFHTVGEAHAILESEYGARAFQF